MYFMSWTAAIFPLSDSKQGIPDIFWIISSLGKRIAKRVKKNSPVGHNHKQLFEVSYRKAGMHF